MWNAKGIAQSIDHNKKKWRIVAGGRCLEKMVFHGD